MREAERLSALIGDIYDAAPPSHRRTFSPSQGHRPTAPDLAALSWKDAVSKTGINYHEDGSQDPNFRKLYFDKYVKMDPFTTGQYFAEIGEPIATADMIPYEEFPETRIYKEWARPQGPGRCRRHST
jgi:hypothetical protein